MTHHGIAYHDDPRLHLVTASVPGPRTGESITYGVYLKFTFDAEGRLREHEIKALGTGP